MYKNRERITIIGIIFLLLFTSFFTFCIEDPPEKPPQSGPIVILDKKRITDWTLETYGYLLLQVKLTCENMNNASTDRRYFKIESTDKGTFGVVSEEGEKPELLTTGETATWNILFDLPVNVEPAKLIYSYPQDTVVVNLEQK